mmetsp:Transcript_84649/g.244703  ORF Transcript_84649/g.244703 Transcript_84649/m.244703 type:complete len:231 (-) Transcript_84649:275-967(-)
MSLSIFGIFIKINLGVTDDNVSIGGFCEGINFDLGTIRTLKEGIEVLHELNPLVPRLGSWFHSKISGHAFTLIILNPLGDINTFGKDFFWIGLGDIFNRGSSGRRSNQQGSLTGTVHDDTQIHFTAHIESFHEQDPVADNTVGCLFGDEFVSQHFGSHVFGLTRFGNKVNTSLESIFKGSKTPTTTEDLGLDDTILEWFTGLVDIVKKGIFRFIWCTGHKGTRNLDAVVL